MSVQPEGLEVLFEVLGDLRSRVDRCKCALDAEADGYQEGGDALYASCRRTD